MIRLSSFVAIFCLLNQNSAGQFIPVTNSQLGISIVTEGTLYGDGISFYDFNSDGWDDLTIANGAEDPIFFVNLEGQFQEISFDIFNEEQALILMILWVDFDNDGDADLFVTRYQAPIQLWLNNGNFEFENIASAAGLEQDFLSYWGAAFADYDHDGCLDLFVAKYYNPNLDPEPEYRSLFYHNNCNGTFTEVTSEAGINIGPRPCFQPVFLDYDNDGWEDLFLAIDRILFPNELYKNNGNGTFTNVSIATGANATICSMSGTVGDFDNDQDDDIFVANGPTGNILMRNEEGILFTEVASEYNVVMNQLCWGSMWLDYDNDSWQDLIVSVTSPYLEPIGNQLFINNAGIGFTNSTFLSGFDDDSSETYVAAMGDFNRDGYYDFVQNNAPPFSTHLWQNDGGENQFLSVSLEGVFANKDGIGSRIHCYTLNEHYMRYTHCGENFIAQNSNKEIFGLGNSAMVDSLIVEWNSGTRDVFYNIPAGQFLHIREGDSYIYEFQILADDDLLLCPGESTLLDAGEFETYLWSTGEVSRFNEVSESGNFSVTVTNIFGATMVSENIQVDISDLDIDALLVEDVSCYDASTGMLTIMINEELVNSVLWNTGSDSLSAVDLSAGDYFYFWEDINGCAHEGMASISEPAELQVEVVAENVSCHGSNDGRVEIFISGGTYPYEINWGTFDPQLLEEGDYSFEVMDAHGCSLVESVTILEPDAIFATTEIENVLCYAGFDGHVQVEVSGGVEPYTIHWQGQNPESMTSGSYECIIEDSEGCEYHLFYEVQQPDPLIVLITTSDATCNDSPDGSAQAVISGGTEPYQTTWDGTNPDGLSYGEYSMWVHDAHNCLTEVTFEIDAPDPLVCIVTTNPQLENGANGNAQVEIVGGTIPYQIDWSNGLSGFVLAENLISGNYFVEITDGHGCTCSQDFEIDFIQNMNETIRPLITPYPNPAEDKIHVDTQAISCIAFNLMGTICFDRKCHGGLLDASDLVSGYYLLVLTLADGKVQRSNMLIR